MTGHKVQAYYYNNDIVKVILYIFYTLSRTSLTDVSEKHFFFPFETWLYIRRATRACAMNTKWEHIGFSNIGLGDFLPTLWNFLTVHRNSLLKGFMWKSEVRFLVAFIYYPWIFTCFTTKLHPLDGLSCKTFPHRSGFFP